MKYQLEDLLRVRFIREEAARREVAQAKRRLEEAREELEKRKKQLKEYHEWRIKEEDRHYQKVHRKKVKHLKINQLKAEMAWMKKDEIKHEKNVDKAKEKCQEEEKKLEEARGIHFQTLRQLQKMQEHKRIWKLQSAKDREKAEDKETEEFKANIKEQIEFNTEE